MIKYNEFFIWNFYKVRGHLFRFSTFLVVFKNYFFLSLLVRRLEFFNNNQRRYDYFITKFILRQFKPLTLYFYKNFLTNKLLLHVYIKLKINLYVGYRHFFGLPVRGARTWSNHKTQKKNNTYFYTYCKYLFFKKYKNYCIKSREKIVLYLEFANLFWYHYFRDEWLVAKEKRLEFEQKKSYIRWVYDAHSLLANRACVFLEKNKKNKKKIKIKQNFFNVGFVFLFTKFFQKIVFKNYSLLKKN